MLFNLERSNVKFTTLFTILAILPKSVSLKIPPAELCQTLTKAYFLNFQHLLILTAINFLKQNILIQIFQATFSEFEWSSLTKKLTLNASEIKKVYSTCNLY